MSSGVPAPGGDFAWARRNAILFSMLKRSSAVDSREKAKRAALNALRRTKRAADLGGVSLSEWEGEFLGLGGGPRGKLRPRISRS
jgi:hypothetical protein